MKVEIVLDGDDDGAAKWVLVKSEDDQYFRVSTVVAFDTGLMETLCFPCDKDAVVSNWTEFAGGIGMTRSQAIEDLEHRLDTGEEKGMDEFVEHMGGPNVGTLIGMMGDMKDAMLGTKRSTEPDPEDLL